jgi:hypothetical protein
MRRWEYIVVTTPDAMESSRLNELGDDGWEFIGVTRRVADGHYMNYFKRELFEGEGSSNV